MCRQLAVELGPGEQWAAGPMADVAPESCLTRLMRPPIALGGSRGSAFPSILDSPCDLDSASPPRAHPPLCAPHIARPPGAHFPVCARPLCTAISSLLIAISKQYPHLARARPYQVSIWPSMLPQLHLNYLVKVRRALSPSKLCLPPATLELRSSSSRHAGAAH